MREVYWRHFTQLKMDEFYYTEYQTSSARYMFVVSILTNTISIVLIVLWSFFDHLSALWAVVIGVMQILNMVRHQLPFSRRIDALKHFLPDLARLLNEVKRDWGRIYLEELAESHINDLIYSHEQRYADLLDKYAVGGLFLENKRFAKIAEARRIDYFKGQYGTEPLETIEEVYSK